MDIADPMIYHRVTMGLLITMLAGAVIACFSLGYKFRRRFNLSIEWLVFVFSLFLPLFALLFVFLFKQHFFSRPALFIGIPTGICFAFAIYTYHKVINMAKLNVSWTIIQFSVLLPFLFSIFYYKENPPLSALIGVGIIFISIILFGTKDEKTKRRAIPDIRTGLLLFTATFLSGVNQILIKIYASVFNQKDTFTLFIYSGITMAFTTVWIVFTTRKKRALAAGPAHPLSDTSTSDMPAELNQVSIPRKRHLLMLAAFMGFFSILGMGLTIIGLKTVPGSIAYPLRNAVNIIVVFVLSHLFFKETTRKIEFVGIAVAITGIVILSSSMVS